MWPLFNVKRRKFSHEKEWQMIKVFWQNLLPAAMKEGLASVVVLIKKTESISWLKSELPGDWFVYVEWLSDWQPQRNKGQFIEGLKWGNKRAQWRPECQGLFSIGHWPCFPKTPFYVEPWPPMTLALKVTSRHMCTKHEILTLALATAFKFAT